MATPIDCHDGEDVQGRYSEVIVTSSHILSYESDIGSCFVGSC